MRRLKPSFGSNRAAMAFKPTKSGTVQLLSMRGRCVIPYPVGLRDRISRDAFLFLQEL